MGEDATHRRHHELIEPARPPKRACRTLHTGSDLLTDTQWARLDSPCADDAHAEVHATWDRYQQMFAAYRHPDRTKGREAMRQLVEALSSAYQHAYRDEEAAAHPHNAAPATC